MDTAAENVASGWLLTQIEYDHPGYLAAQADRARDQQPDVAAVFEKWAADVARWTAPKIAP